MSWLTDRQLNRCVRLNADKSTSLAFQGVHMIDKLPRAVTHYPCLIIINTQSFNTPGEHWIAAFIGENRRGEIFDSLASRIPVLLERWMNTFSLSHGRNNLQYQHPLSSRCGAYVLFFVLHRLKTPDCIRQNFTSSLYDNERRVSLFYSKLKK